jgi:hypothetical protein
MRAEGGQIHHFETVGTYDDVWVKTPEGWRIKERTWNQGWIWGDYPLQTLPGDF